MFQINLFIQQLLVQSGTVITSSEAVLLLLYPDGEVNILNYSQFVSNFKVICLQELLSREDHFQITYNGLQSKLLPMLTVAHAWERPTNVSSLTAKSVHSHKPDKVDYFIHICGLLKEIIT